jgi:integrase
LLISIYPLFLTQIDLPHLSLVLRSSIDTEIIRITAHNICHLSGSFLLDQGGTPGYIQDHLGHSSIEMTMNIDRHKIRKYNRKAVEKLRRGFSVPMGAKWGQIG